MYKLDLHTHSELSHDGAITLKHYRKILESGKLDFIAITDHNEINFALNAKKVLGEKIIVGEEISSGEGHIIGLFLKEKVQKGLSALETIDQIHSQNGLAYVVHPFDSRRSGITIENLNKIVDKVDILEIFNSRYVTHGGNESALKYAVDNNLTKGVGSDSHRVGELGRNYNIINDIPSRDNLKNLLSDATYYKNLIYPWQYFNPTLNRFLKKFQ